MVSAANKQIVKMVTWTAAGRAAFTTLKELVNEFPKIYFIKKEYKIILYTDASDYAHGAYLCQVIPAVEGRAEYEESIRFLSGSFHGAQTRWSTIKKEAYAIYWALGKLDDLLGGIVFTRFIRTDHHNLLYMNNHGSRKVLQWKLDIQHYDAIIEHVTGVMNTPANVFSRLVEKEMTSEVNHVTTLTCSVTQREIIKHHHEWLCDHNGVDRTLALMTQRYPEETSTAQWPQLRHDVREYIQSCATCQKMEVRHKSIQASNFVLSTLKPMQRIALDMDMDMDISTDFRYIIVVIDTFTRYVELFPANDVTAAAAATDAFMATLLPVRNAP
jgi:hypothetical protein